MSRMTICIHRHAGTLFLALSLCFLIACGATRTATDTPKPVGGAIQPPLSADERKAQSVAIEFVQHAMRGEDREKAQARALMEPTYGAMVPNLYDALGLQPNPSDGYSVVPDHREGGAIVFVVNIDYRGGRQRGWLTVTPGAQGWRVTHIVAVAPSRPD